MLKHYSAVYTDGGIGIDGLNTSALFVPHDSLLQKDLLHGHFRLNPSVFFKDSAIPFP